MVSNIEFVAAVPGATEIQCTVKEASWVPSQAWFEQLRYYPTPDAQEKHGAVASQRGHPS